jgi:DNA-binding transcriptional ArsR family regulator
VVADSTDEILRALADGTRREILRLVWSQERASGEIAAHFALTRQAVSQHLGVMLDCELVSVRQDGTKRLYRANRRPIAELRAEFDQFWDEGLDRLRTAAQEMETSERDPDAAPN